MSNIPKPRDLPTLVQLRSDKVTIHTGDYAGRMLVDVLTEDLMEAA